jgi:hypothetical protein
MYLLYARRGSGWRCEVDEEAGGKMSGGERERESPLPSLA